MHGMYVKIIEAQQARLCNNSKSTKLKLLKTNAAIWFNKMCKIKHLKPNYINIKINDKSHKTRRPQQMRSNEGYIEKSNFSAARNRTSINNYIVYV